MSDKPSAVITEYPKAPLPTGFTLAMRRNPIVQLFKFASICLNIMMMVIKGHDQP